jgi:hypothetical protein
MRVLLGIALLGMSLAPLSADDPVEKRADPQAFPPCCQGNF